MASILRRNSCVSVFAILAFVVLFQFGCGGTSPFLAAQFATTIGTVPRPGPPANGGGGDGGDDSGDTITSVCDLNTGLQTVEITLQNESPERVRFAITLLASAGAGGFVCDEQVQAYEDAGYSEANLTGSPASITIGCDTIQLVSGDRILRRNFGVNDPLGEEFLPPAVGGAETTIQLGFRDSGQELLPLPEAIVLGANVSPFTCIGSNLCTQSGFVYANSSSGVTIQAVTATNTQGTFCNEGAGTAPEWRLDKTLNDNQTANTQYPAGAVIVVTVLDRAGETTSNQVVWAVSDSTGADVHIPQP